MQPLVCVYMAVCVFACTCSYPEVQSIQKKYLALKKLDQSNLDVRRLTVGLC